MRSDAAVWRHTKCLGPANRPDLAPARADEPCARPPPGSRPTLPRADSALARRTPAHPSAPHGLAQPLTQLGALGTGNGAPTTQRAIAAAPRASHPLLRRGGLPVMELTDAGGASLLRGRPMSRLRRGRRTCRSDSPAAFATAQLQLRAAHASRRYTSEPRVGTPAAPAAQAARAPSHPCDPFALFPLSRPQSRTSSES